MTTSIAIATPASGSTAAPVAVPAPSGFAQTVSLPFTSVPAGTTVAVTSAVGIPANDAGKIPVLSRNRMSAASLRSTLDASGFTTLLYDIVVPSATVTLAGPASTTFTLPASSATAGSSYYLGFYDPTVANPAWNTIAGPVTATAAPTGGTTVTFSGTLPSYTLTANATYAVAVFSVASGTTPPPAAPTPSPSPSPTPTPTPTPSPTPTPATLAYVPVAGTNTIDVMSTTAVVNTITVGQSAGYLSMDDAGNMYVLSFASNTAPGVIERYGPTTGTTATATATYTPSSGASPQLLLASGTGEVVVISTTGPAGGAVTGTVTDIWDAGSAGGAPSRSITHAANGGAYIVGGAITHTGTLYLAYSASVGVSYDVIPPGTSTPSRTIVESVVSPANQYQFFPNYMAVAPDGTLYVTEWTFGQYTPDTYAGLYTYPTTGAETYQPIPNGPQGVDVDGSGNVYVTVNNSVNNSADTQHALNIYAPHATSLTRTVNGNWLDAYPLTVGGDGTAFFSTYSPNKGVWSLLPGATTATQITATADGNDIILYNGSTEITSRGRSVASFGGSAAGAGHTGGAHRAR